MWQFKERREEKKRVERRREGNIIRNVIIERERKRGEMSGRR